MQRTMNNVWKKQYRQAVLLVLLLVVGLIVVTVMTETLAGDGAPAGPSLVVRAISPVEMPAVVATTRAAEPPPPAKPAPRVLTTPAAPESVSSPASVPVFPFPRRGTPRHRVHEVVIHGDPEDVQLLMDATGTWTQVERAVTSTAVSDEEITEVGRMLLRAGRSAGYPATEIAHFPKMLSVGSLAYRAKIGNRSVAAREASLAAPAPVALPEVDATPLPAAKPLSTSVVERPAPGKSAPVPPAAPTTVAPPTGAELAPTGASIVAPPTGAEVAPTAAPPTVTARVPAEAKTSLSRPREVDEILRRGIAPAPVPAKPVVSPEAEETAEPPAVTAVAPDLPRVSEAPPSTPDTETLTPGPVVAAGTAKGEDGRRLWWPFPRWTSAADPIATARESKPVAEKPSRWRPFGRGSSLEKTAATTVDAKPAAEERRTWWPFRTGASSEETVVKAVDEEATGRKPRRLRWPFTGRSVPSEASASAETQAIAVPRGDAPDLVSVTLLQATTKTVTPAEVAQGGVVRRTRR